MVSVESRSTWAFDFAIDSPAQSSKEAYGVSLGMIGATDGHLGSCELLLRYAPPAVLPGRGRYTLCFSAAMEAVTVQLQKAPTRPASPCSRAVLQCCHDEQRVSW